MAKRGVQMECKVVKAMYSLWEVTCSEHEGLETSNAEELQDGNVEGSECNEDDAGGHMHDDDSGEENEDGSLDSEDEE